MAKLLTITIDDKRLQLAIGKVGENLRSFRRFWRDFFAPQFFADAQKNLASEGQYVGGWRALSPRYAAWKLKHFGPRPILVLRGRLRRSFTIGAAENIIRAGAMEAYFGSRVPYVPYHQSGTSRIPRRQIMWLGPNRTYKRLLTQFIGEQIGDAGFRVRSA